MKKKVVIILVIIAIAVVAIVIGAIFLPKITGEDAAGTIGKAEKFRKGQFSEEDILLRDDILEDTAAVGKTLDQILAFTTFFEQEKIIIDSLWIGELKKSCPMYPDCDECSYCKEAIRLLQDYSGFMENNKQTIKTTVEILLAAYNGKEKEFTFDVGVKILSFVQFIDEMVKRDSVLTTTIHLVDQYISKEKNMDKKRQAAVNKLKKVRDKMVIDNLLFAMKTGDKKQYDQVASMPLAGNVEDIKNVYVGSSAGAIGSAQTIGSAGPVLGNSSVSVIGNSPTIGSYGAGRYDNAAYGSAPVIGLVDNQVVRNSPAIGNAVGLDNMPDIKSAPSFSNLVGAGFSNIAIGSSNTVIGSVDGTIFNQDVFSAINPGN